MGWGIQAIGDGWPSSIQIHLQILQTPNPPMLAPLDTRTRQFYMEMGYSEQQVLKAHEYALRKKIDILDALAMQLQSPPSAPPPPPRSPPNPPAGSSSAPLPTSSFLTPLSQIRPAEYETLFSRSSKFNALSSRYELREPNHPVGLLNISNCCYLNSLLQCYFLMHKFKQILLTAEPLQEIAQILAENKTKLKRVKGEYELLAKLKNFFTLMALTSKKYLDPTDVLQNLVDSVGEKLTYGEEKDLSEINIMVIERLSQGLTFSKKYFQKEDPQPQRGSFIDQGEIKRYNSIFNPENGLIKQLFYGTKVEYYRQKQIGKQEQIVSDFTGIILNPRFGTLENALDEQFNFSVQIKGETFSKQMFIREEPEYLFLYINRTQFDREEQQMHKNDQKFTFDFVLYLDRYMEKYREERGQKDEKIRSLIQIRNRVKEQLSSLQILAKKMEECYEFARGLQGWVEKLPSQEEFQAEERRLSDQLAIVQRELQQVQSRREEYHLMYIFVHRGDAVSGHYWGYGRNGGSWYRFDINCRLIPQEQILIDMEKSSGTPYALLFVKKENLPQFKYNYHVRTNIRANQPEYAKFFDERLAEEIIRDNILLHQEVQAKNYEILKKKCFADYVARYNALKKIVKVMVKPKGEGSRLDSLPICNNFTFFLQSKGETELYKFSIFEQSLLASSGGKVTIERLMHDADLLSTIQKKFKLKCKGELHLKNYAMVGKDLDKYLKLQQEYQLNVFEVIWGLTAIAAYERLHPLLEKIPLKGDFIEIQLDGDIAAALSQIVSCLRVRNSFLKNEQYQKMKSCLDQTLYMTQVNNEVSKLIMLKLVTLGFKFQSLGKYVELADSAGTQIATINAANIISTSTVEMQSAYTIIEEVQELIRRFFAQNLSNNRKGSVAQSGSKVDRRSSSKVNNNLDSVSSSGTPPFKSGAFSRSSSIQNKRPAQPKLTAFAKSVLIFLDTRQTWKTEQLQGSKANFDFSTKILTFLKRLAPIVRVYRKTLQAGRALTPPELSSLGVLLNHPKLEPQSLI